MKPKSIARFLPVGLVFIGLAVIVGGGYYFGSNFVAPAAPPEVALPVLSSPTPSVTPTATQASSPTAIPSPTSPAATISPPEVPSGGIVYSLSPDINSVGWVQDGKDGNHFGESFLYTGVREGAVHHGAMQFDLSFIPKGSTIFLAQLELTGLSDEGLTQDSAFAANILAEEVDDDWSRHSFDIIHTAPVDEALEPVLQAADLAAERTNKIIFNAAQRSIIEQRLETGRISFRLESLFPEGWFSWDSGYGAETLGEGPVLRLGVLPPVATAVANETPELGTPTPEPTFVLITSTPTPENVQTAAAIAPTLTAAATTVGTPTPLPQNWVTPIVVTNTPTPENEATAAFLQAEVAAAVIAFGTSTPAPQNLITATPTPTETPTPVFILLDGELPPMTPGPPVEVTPGPTRPVPPELIGKIVFKSNRTGQQEFYVINPDGTELALLTDPWPYNVAKLADTFSPDGRFRVFTKDVIRYKRTGSGQTLAVETEMIPGIYWRDAHYDVEEQLTFFGAGIAHSGVWSPTGEQIVLVSNDSGDDEIWVIDRDGTNPRQLTESNEAFNAREIGKDTFIPEVNKDPSWSPDGSQIVFWSNRTGHAQIWVMNSDGSNLYSLSRTDFDDWDPVWIKYSGVSEDALEKHAPYIGPYDLLGADRNCDDFDPGAEPHESAQSFYWAAGGPARDPHGLDGNNDGIACN